MVFIQNEGGAFVERIAQCLQRAPIAVELFINTVGIGVDFDGFCIGFTADLTRFAEGFSFDLARFEISRSNALFVFFLPFTSGLLCHLGAISFHAVIGALDVSFRQDGAVHLNILHNDATSRHILIDGFQTRCQRFIEGIFVAHEVFSRHAVDGLHDDGMDEVIKLIIRACHRAKFEGEKRRIGDFPLCVGGDIILFLFGGVHHFATGNIGKQSGRIGFHLIQKWNFPMQTATRLDFHAPIGGDFASDFIGIGGVEVVVIIDDDAIDDPKTAHHALLCLADDEEGLTKQHDGYEHDHYNADGAHHLFLDFLIFLHLIKIIYVVIHDQFPPCVAAISVVLMVEVPSTSITLSTSLSGSDTMMRPLLCKMASCVSIKRRVRVMSGNA